jgi:hypothetical protein
MKIALHTFLWRRITLFAFACALLLLTVVASAHQLGGQFPYRSGTWLYISYTQSGAYASQVSAAASSWHNTPTRLIVYRTYNYSTSKADFYTVYRSDSWWGLTVHHPCSGWGCIYRWADLYLNSRTLNVESSLIRQKVAAHEFGHGIGLAHAPTWAFYRSIMKQGRLSYNLPQSHDINDTNELYPYW